MFGNVPGQCHNARRPSHGNVKCCIDTSGISDDWSGAKSGGKSSHSGGKSSHSGGGSSKGPDVYTCTYSCGKGFKLNGPSVLECPINSVSDNPTCTLG